MEMISTNGASIPDLFGSSEFVSSDDPLHEEIISCISALDEVLAQFDDSSLPFIPPEDDNKNPIGTTVDIQTPPSAGMDQNQNWNGSGSVIIGGKPESSQMIIPGSEIMSQSYTAGVLSSREVNGNCFGGTYSKGTSCDLILPLGKGTVTTSSQHRPSIMTGEVTPQGKIRSTLNMALFTPSPPVTRKLPPEGNTVTTISIPGNSDEHWNFHSDKNLPRSLRKTRKTCFLEEGDTSMGSRSESPFCSESSTLEQSGASDLLPRSPRIPRSLIPGRCEIVNKGDGNFALECGPRGRKLGQHGSTSSPGSTFTTSSGVSLSVTSGPLTSDGGVPKGRPRQQLPSPSRTPQVPPPPEVSSGSPLEIRDEDKDTSQESLGGDGETYLSSSNASPLKTCHPDILMRNKSSDTDFEETCSDSKLIGRKREGKRPPQPGNLNGSLPNQTQMMRMMMMLKTPKTNSVGSGSSSRSSSSSSGSVSVKSSSSEDCGGGEDFHEKIVEDFPKRIFGGKKEAEEKVEEEKVVVVLRPKRETGRGGIPLLQQGREMAQGGGTGLEIDDGYLSMINRNEAGPLWPEEFIENETFSTAELKRLSVSLEEEVPSEVRRERRDREKTDYFSDDSLEEDGSEKKKEDVVVIKQSTSFVIPFHTEGKVPPVEEVILKTSPVKKSNSHVSRIPKPAGVCRRKSSSSRPSGNGGVVRKPCSFFIPLSDSVAVAHVSGGSDRKVDEKSDSAYASGLAPNNPLRATSLPSSRRNSESLQGAGGGGGEGCSGEPPKSGTSVTQIGNDKASTTLHISSANPPPEITQTNPEITTVTVTTPEEESPPEKEVVSPLESNFETTTPSNLGGDGEESSGPGEVSKEQILIDSGSRSGSASPRPTPPTGPGQRLSDSDEPEFNPPTDDKTVTKTNPDKCEHLNQVLSVWEEYSSGTSPPPTPPVLQQPLETSETIKQDLEAVVKMFLAATEGLLEPISFSTEDKGPEELPTFDEAAEPEPLMCSTPKVTRHPPVVDNPPPAPVSPVPEEDDQPPAFIPEPPPAVEPVEVTMPSIGPPLATISLNPAPQTEQPLDLLSQRIARCPSPVENMSVSQFLHNKKNIWAMYDRPYDEDVLPPSFPRGYASRSQENLIDAMSHERLTKSFSARGQSSTLPLNCRPPPVQRRTSTFRNMFNKFRKHKTTDTVIPEGPELRDEEAQSITSRETGPSEGKKRSFFSRLFRRSRKH